MSDPKYKYFELSNGVRACLVPVPGLSSVTIQVFVKIGSKYEEEKVWGISHFLEHMAFKGTKKRKTSLDISKEFDRVGSGRNASTSNECTRYYVSTNPKHLEWGIEILSDMLLNPSFPEKEIKKELGVIVEEINMYEDNPTDGLWADFYNLMYKTSKVGCWNVLGTKKSVLGINREDLVGFREKYLNSKEMVVVAAGNLGGKEKEIQEWIKRYFSDFRPNLKNKLPKVEMELGQKTDFRKKKGLDQAHFGLGMPSISRKDKRRYAMKLLDIILCGNSSSRMWQLVREEMGAAYYLFPISESLAEGGFTGVQAGVTKNRVEEVVEAVKKEYLEIGKTVKEEDLMMAKDYLNGRLALAMDASGFWANLVGSKLLLDRKLVKVSEELLKYKRVSLGEVKQLAKEFFTGKNFRLVVID